MSAPSRAVPRPRQRWRGLLALPVTAAAALGLAIASGSAAGAATHTATAPLHTYHVAPNGTDTSGSCTANTTSNAFPTIADALACAVNGDAISLAPTGTAVATSAPTTPGAPDDRCRLSVRRGAPHRRPGHHGRHRAASARPGPVAARAPPRS